MKLSRLFTGLLAVTVLLLSSILAPTSAFAATAGVSVDITARAQGRFYGAAQAGVGQPSLQFDLLKLTQLQPGTGTGYADLIYTGTRTIAASSSENLDLSGSLTGPLGSTLTFVKVKAILIVADAGNTNNVVVGGAGSNTFTGPFADATDKLSIPPGGSLLLTHPGAGWTVTASTGDILLVANSSSGSGVTYKVMIIGTSA